MRIAMSIIQSSFAALEQRSRDSGQTTPRATLLAPLLTPLKYWLPTAVAATLLAALIYGAVQQNIRLSANDPQIQVAEDTAQRLGQGGQPDAQLAQQPVDIAKSLAVFTMVFDAAGQPRVSGAQLDGQIPVVPAGIFDYVRSHDEERVTWQPRPGVRIAAVVTRYSGTQSGFVLAGRSLREVEKRTHLLTLQVGVAWLATMVGSLLTAIGIAIALRFRAVRYT